MGVVGRQELVGRDQELALLVAAVDEAHVGRGSLVMVEGEAGIGKTRLLAETEDHARRLAFRCLRGGALELEQGRPFGAFRDALGLETPDGPGTTALARTVSESAASPEAQFLAQEAIVEYVEGLTEDAPLLLALDDLHWSDRATLATVWALARRVDPLPFVLLIAARPNPRSAELDRLLSDARSAGATELRLRALAPEAVEELAGSVVGASAGPSLLDQLAGTGGNPFFVIEMLTSLVDEGVVETADGGAEARARSLPPELRASLLRRIGALGTDAQDVLGIAAVLAGPFAIDDLSAVLGRPTAAWTEVVTSAVRAGILEDRGTVLAFRHDLIREALYEHLPEAVRTGLHRDAARVLGDRLEPSVRARHLVLGAAVGDTDAVDDLRRAARELARRNPDAAASVFERAEALERDPLARAELAAGRANCLLAAGRPREAEACATDALHVVGVPSAIRASLLLTLGETDMHQGKAYGGVEHFRGALDVGIADEDERARALGKLAESTLWTFDLEAAWDSSARALAEGERMENATVVALALSTQSATRIFSGRLREAVALGEQAVESAGGDPDALRTTPHSYHALALLGSDQHGASRAVAEEGLRHATALGQVLTMPNFHIVLLRLAWFTGRWDDALAEAAVCSNLAADFGLRFGLAHTDTIQGLIAFHRGDLDGAREMQLRAKQGREHGDVGGSEMGFLLDALIAEADGEVAEAAELLAGYVDFMLSIGMRAHQLWIGPQVVQMLLAANRAADARALAATLDDIGTTADTPSGRAGAATARGLVDDDPGLLLAAADEYAERAPAARRDAHHRMGGGLIRAGGPSRRSRDRAPSEPRARLSTRRQPRGATPAREPA